MIFVDRQIRNTLTGNLRAVEHGSDHGVSYVASTLHWGPDASHNAYYLTHKGKYGIQKFRLKIMPSSIVSILNSNKVVNYVFYIFSNSSSSFS